MPTISRAPRTMHGEIITIIYFMFKFNACLNLCLNLFIKHNVVIWYVGASATRLFIIIICLVPRHDVFFSEGAPCMVVSEGVVFIIHLIIDKSNRGAISPDPRWKQPYA